MMEVIDIMPEHRLWSQVWALYMESFPPHERRREPSHARATADPRFRTQAAVDGERLLGLLFWWQGGGMVFVEHLAVPPALRGRNIGSRLLTHLAARTPGEKIILEIDPPVDVVSIRRLRFYERLGFRANAYPYTHASYAQGGAVHPLVILSYPDALDPGEFLKFVGFLHASTLRYKD